MNTNYHSSPMLTEIFQRMKNENMFKLVSIPHVRIDLRTLAPSPFVLVKIVNRVDALETLHAKMQCEGEQCIRHRG